MERRAEPIAQRAAMALPRAGRRSFLRAAAAAGLAAVSPLGTRGQSMATVAAASDLKFALDALAAAFRAETRREVRIAYGSSGNFYRQLVAGAPFELFLSADEDFVLRLAQSGLTADRGSLYGIGRIVLFSPTGSPIVPDAELRDVRAAVTDGRLKRFAIANPEHAPYGRAAEQALRSFGLWEAVRPRLVLGENVSQAAQFATGGSAQGGIFALSLALAPDVARRGRHALIGAEHHAPLRQRMVLLKGAGDTARAFHDFIRTPRAREMLRGWGFALPEGV